MRAALIAIAVAGCHRAPPRQPLYPAGSEKDEGHGLLAHISASLLTSDETDVSVLPAPRADAFGGAAYGGSTYAGYTAPAWPYPSANRAAHYTTVAGLGGIVEGRVISHAPAATTLTTTCGTIPVSSGVAGALVYIEHVTTGRILASEGGERRPSTVGGIVAKHGCAFVPTVQPVTPLPASLSVHGDATRTTVRITDAGGTANTYDLDAGGRVAMEARPGVTRVEAEDGTVGAAWIVALETPAYAVTDDAGRFRIEELAAGTYDVTFWLPPIATVQDGRLRYGEPRIMHRAVTVTVGRPARLDVVMR